MKQINSLPAYADADDSVRTIQSMHNTQQI